MGFFTGFTNKNNISYSGAVGPIKLLYRKATFKVADVVVSCGRYHCSSSLKSIHSQHSIARTRQVSFKEKTAIEKTQFAERK